MNLLWPLLFSAIAWFLLFYYLKRRLDSLSRDDGQIQRVRQELNQLIMELDLTTERNIELLENKIGELKGISNEAQREIQLLRQQKEEYSQALNRYRELGRKENNLIGKKIHQEEKHTEPSKKLSPKERVLQQFRGGAAPEEIARIEEIPLGEVELIISLNNLGDKRGNS
ncbi:MAG: hypothetical protein PF447_03750 [Spirochaetaceae bacterium]|jgi:DNA repair ATPase RecN|nr:hypothetical protein [Spirochaetaceae bacterium]